MKMKEQLRIGAGAGYSGDRIEPAVDLAAKGKLDYLVFECLAERTIALAQERKAKNPQEGFDPLLEERMRACLPVCRQNKVKIISNMGAANPIAALRKTAEIAADLGLKHLKIAAVVGDDVLSIIKNGDYTFMESGESAATFEAQIISANAYMGVAGILEALQNQADVVLTGRVADPALFLAPVIYEFGWSLSDYDLMGKGTVLGHLMECAGQVSGGYFADPDFKEIPDLANLGFPIAEIKPDGSFFITKLPRSGGRVTTATCKEQLLYEIHDPSNYLTPDVRADFTKVTVDEVAPDKVAVNGGTGKAPGNQLKVSVGYREGFIGEGQISYGGAGAVRRAQLALDVLKKRLQAIAYSDLRFDIIGVNSLYGAQISKGEPFEVRARVAARTTDRQAALKIGNEVEALYTNGPAGGGGAIKSIREVIAIQSVLIDAHLVEPSLRFIDL